MAATLPKTRRARRTWPQRLLIAFNLFVVTACLVTAGGLFYAYDRLSDLPRIALDHVLSPETDDPVAGEARNFLLVGSDTRATQDPEDVNGGIGTADEVGGQRSDTIMILRVEPATNQAAILSLPRDLWVPISGGRSKGRINSAFNSGPDVLIKTIEDNFDIPINHYVEVDFTGFQSLVDAIGGVEVYFPAPARDANTGLNITAPGCVRLDGEYGLAYVRSRHYEALVDGKWKTDPLSDLDRIKRQQSFIKLSLERAVEKGVRSPSVLNELLDVATQSVTLDSNLTVRDLFRLGNQLRNFDPDSLQTYTLPTQGTMMGEAAVLLPKTSDPEFDSILNLFRNGLSPEEQSTTTTATTAPPPSDVRPADVSVRVLNGSGRGGLAADTSTALTGAGFAVQGRGDAERFDYKHTIVRYVAGQQSAAQLLASYVEGGADLEATPSLPRGVDVALVIGQDFTSILSAPGAATTTTAPAETVPPPTPDTVAPDDPFLPPPGATCG
jgi:LCP family protein required for cell wall assembly